MERFLLSGDRVVFEPNFAPAVAVGVLTVEVKGSAVAAHERREMCIEEEVTSIRTSVSYVTPQYAIPGSGQLRVEHLDTHQRSRVVKIGTEPAVLAGGTMRAKLEVRRPATMPGSGAPDTKRTYLGKARFAQIGHGPRGD